MPNTTSYERGDVVLVRFPFTDLQATKQRPALVISGDRYTRRGGDVILAAITSNRVDDPGPFDHLLSDWRTSGLLRASVVRAGKLATLDRAMIQRTLGKIAEADFREVERRVREALDLTAS